MRQVADTASYADDGLRETTSPATASLRVAVLSDHALTRAGLSHFLSHGNADISVVEGPVPAGHLWSHDVVVYDLADESGHTLDSLAVLLAEGIPVVALTSPGRRHLAETLLAIGVAETVQMDLDAVGLVRALERAAAGRSTTADANRRRHRATVRAATGLTERELSVLELVGAGLPNREIAERLDLSINTLKTYIRTAYRKIEVTRRSQAVLWAARHDLFPHSRCGPDLADRAAGRDRTPTQRGLSRPI